MDGYYVPSLYRWRDEEQAQQAGSWIEPVEEGLPTHIQKRVFEGFAESPGWEPCIVPVHRGGAGPPQRGGAARVRPRLPVLPGGHDVPPGA